MSATSTMNAGRAMAESLMLERVLVERSTGIHYNPVTKRDEETFATVYDGPGKWQIDNAKDPRTVEVAGTTYTLGPIELHIPVGASVEVKPAMRATAVTGVYDASMAGRQFWIVADHTKTFATARRLGCQEV